ncbi:hypothetical protein [Shinella sp. M31]|uniref:hypothetical protein n=1 Tax=Shinella sp. M31 TaxID=3368615 RepID=UPI003B9F684E
MKLVRYNNDVYQIVDDEGGVKYLALRLANGKWGAYDGNDVRLSKRSFVNPRQVLAFIAGRDALEKERGDG